MSKQGTEKFNIFLIILIFVIPLIALDFTFYFISNINYKFEKRNQEKTAIQEAECLSFEGNFNNEFTIHFSDFFEELQKTVKTDHLNTSDLVNHLKTNAKIIFEKPFPKHNLYVFKIPYKTNKTELIYYNGSIKAGKTVFCKTFEYLFNIHKGKKSKTDENLAKILLGKYTDFESIAYDLRGVTTYTNGIFKNSWFIWDYVKTENEDIFGAYLFCDEINDYAKYGRLLALNKLRERGKAVGAFIPVYKDYGEPLMQSPLDKSEIFKKWADNLTVKSAENLTRWLKYSLPQGDELGNYTAFSYLARGNTHIAVVLVKTLKKLIIPKWLISINYFSFLVLFIILYFGLVLKIWPPFSLKARFMFSYALASAVPLSLLLVVAYGYFCKFENTSIEKANKELQMTLKSIDSNKSKIIKDYRTTFEKIVNDPKLIELIKKEGINNELVTKYIVKNFEQNNSLPLLGVKIYDEIGNGSASEGKAKKNLDLKTIYNLFNSSLVEMLRDVKKKENRKIKLMPYEPEKIDRLANNTYKALSDRDLKDDICKYLSIPLVRKNGNYCSYFIFDTIKIDGYSKYMLFVVWDDKSLDEDIVKNEINITTLNNIKQNIIAYSINEQKIKPIGGNIRHENVNFKRDIKRLIKQSSYFKNNVSYDDNENIIFIMPAINFNQIIFVGWINKIDLKLSLLYRQLFFVILLILSLFILWICSLRSSSVFLKPISTLKKALDEVSIGNLNIGIKNDYNNELGNLSNEFDKMIDELREKERLSKLISDNAIQALKKSGSGLLNDTETIQGVALVSDIRNFTGMSEKYDPVIITELLNEHFAEMAKIISDNGGLIYKFIGDAIEAVFPEKEDYDESASERAFKASCLMLSKLAIINSRRNNKGLFSYKIGVGLCYGTMFSGAVGSIHTRIDYSVVGTPLKNAAKFEALSIQNPDFPIVIGENIAKKIASLGFSLKRIDSKALDLSLYTISSNKQLFNDSSFNLYYKEKETKQRSDNSENIKFFSLSKDSYISKRFKDYLFNSFFVIFLSFLISSGINWILNANYEEIKLESSNSTNRLYEQLKCREVLKSSFDAVCFDFYEDINKALNYVDKQKPFKQVIAQIADKYEKKGYPIPYYCCCLFDGNEIKKEGLAFKGFKENTCNLFTKFAISCKSLNFASISKNRTIQTLLGPTANLNELMATHFRHSAVASVSDEEMLLNSERIYDKSHKNIIAYIFCGMPKNVNKSLFPKYYTVLSGKQQLLAIKDNKSWYFSDDFPDKEKDYLMNTTIEEINNVNDYSVSKLEINDKTYLVYAISKDLLHYYNSPKIISIFSFALSLIIFVLLSIFLNKINFFSNNTISGILRKDILLSAIIPLFIVTFISYLYVVEDFNNNKSELIINMNKHMNEVESKELYYCPFCEDLLRNLPNQKIIQNYIKDINTNRGGFREKHCKSLSDYLRKSVVGNVYQKFKFKNINPFIVIQEIGIIGKDNWMSSASIFNRGELSTFGNLLSRVIRTIYFEEHNLININSNGNDKGNQVIKENKISKKASNEEIANLVMKNLASNYGSEFFHKLIYYPDKMIILFNSFIPFGFYINTYPDVYNTEYILFAFIRFENQFVSYICEEKNDLKPFKLHIASGSIGDGIYTFFSSNNEVGRLFFYNESINNEKEDLKTIKELGLAASWLSTSYIPISKKVDINGVHYLEARQGNIVRDNIYASLASEYPIRQKAQNIIENISSILIISVLLIFIISQNVISDLIFPVRQLISGAIAASKGNYKFRTDFRRKDELGALCESFDKMMKGLEEKQLMNRMVSKTALTVSSNIADAESKKIDAVLVYITVPDFDKIMNNTNQDVLFMKLREQIALISELVINHGGDIDKIMGEKMLIAFHIGNKTTAEVVLEACKVAKEIEHNHKLSYKVSVGVNFGQVISGFLGVGEKRDFTVIGDPVNVAARIAVFAEKLDKDKCLISDTVYYYISNTIKAKLYDKIELKGKSQPMKVYLLS